MIGYHYSRVIIPNGNILIGSIIRPTVWNVYKKRADELNLYFPQQMAFAYYIKKFEGEPTVFDYVYTVEAPEEFITAGNTDDSPLVCQANLFQIIDRNLPASLREIRRDEAIAHLARRYFNVNLKTPDNHVLEILSDKWKVIDVEKLERSE